MGASIAHTEMISSHGLVHGGDQTLSYLERPPDERPFAIQVFGHVAEVLAEGARIGVEKYGPIDAVDINMGCPVKKVCCHGAGAAMLKEPSAAERAVRKVVEAVSPPPVTVKLRAGWDEQQRNAPEIAKACEQGGAVAVGVHPRTRAQVYRGRLRPARTAGTRTPIWARRKPSAPRCANCASTCCGTRAGAAGASPSGAWRPTCTPRRTCAARWTASFPRTDRSRRKCATSPS